MKNSVFQKTLLRPYNNSKVMSSFTSPHLRKTSGNEHAGRSENLLPGTQYPQCHFAPRRIHGYPWLPPHVPLLLLARSSVLKDTTHSSGSGRGAIVYDTLLLFFFLWRKRMTNKITTPAISVIHPGFKSKRDPTRRNPLCM